MEIIRDQDKRDQTSPLPVVAIGNFDGVHRGHQSVLRKTVERAEALGGTPTVLTFDPHPLKVLAPGLELKFLMTFQERLDVMETLGIRRVRCVSFSREFASLPPADFARKILREDLGAREILVGAGFVFGKDRKGTIRDLERFSREMGFQVIPVEPLAEGGRPVSSSRIREALTLGRVGEASGLLGRAFSLAGTIVPGARRGKALGFPTANFLPPAERVIPSNGVYAVRAGLGEGKEAALHPAVAYIGTQPTLGPKERMVETHFFRPQGDLYGKSLRVHFMEWIRGEVVFDRKDELVRQIEEDIREAGRILEAG